MKFKDFLNEEKFVEGDKVSFDGKTWEVVEVLGKKDMEIFDGKERVKVSIGQVRKVK